MLTNQNRFLSNMNFTTVTAFEIKIAEFFGAPYAIAVDSCTHGVELALRLTKAEQITVPKNTYLSIPFLADKLNIARSWKDEEWVDYYYLTDRVIDAAVLWKSKSYIPNTFMGISFQYQKHLSLGRGGVLLCDNLSDAQELKKMSYDGRHPGIPWRDQNISSIGYHYYMTPETAQLGLDKLPAAVLSEPRQWTVSDWPDLTQMDIFKNSL
jgi:dTDP-4-amino-4,6-dideoxygalactose transaminase